MPLTCLAERTIASLNTPSSSTDHDELLVLDKEDEIGEEEDEDVTPATRVDDESSKMSPTLTIGRAVMLDPFKCAPTT
jgi:hypothetical protein